jgi:hypothetical protein
MRALSIRRPLRRTPFDEFPSTSSGQAGQAGRADEDHRGAVLNLANAVSARLDHDERGLQLLLGIERQGTGEFGMRACTVDGSIRR